MLSRLGALVSTSIMEDPVAALDSSIAEGKVQYPPGELQVVPLP